MQDDKLASLLSPVKKVVQPELIPPGINELVV